MKKTGKILIIVLEAFILVVAGLLTYVKTMLPSVGDPSDIKVELTAKRRMLTVLCCEIPNFFNPQNVVHYA